MRRVFAISLLMLLVLLTGSPAFQAPQDAHAQLIVLGDRTQELLVSAAVEPDFFCWVGSDRSNKRALTQEGNSYVEDSNLLSDLKRWGGTCEHYFNVQTSWWLDNSQGDVWQDGQHLGKGTDAQSGRGVHLTVSFQSNNDANGYRLWLDRPVLKLFIVPTGFTGGPALRGSCTMPDGRFFSMRFAPEKGRLDMEQFTETVRNANGMVQCNVHTEVNATVRERGTELFLPAGNDLFLDWGPTFERHEMIGMEVLY